MWRWLRDGQRASCHQHDDTLLTNVPVAQRQDRAFLSSSDRSRWEYACRAGTTTTCFFAMTHQAGRIRMAEKNDFKYQKVGKKKPNP
jgi:hypothetical protein